jgi:hypothetical protein
MAETALALRSKAVLLAEPSPSIAKPAPLIRVGALSSARVESSHLGKLQYASDLQKEMYCFPQFEQEGAKCS